MTYAEAEPYRVVPDGDAYRVVDGEDRQVLSCRDASSAQQYAVLMNQAYRSGYRAGHRDARRK